jgi:hypothetical protein
MGEAVLGGAYIYLVTRLRLCFVNYEFVVLLSHLVT